MNDPSLRLPAVAWQLVMHGLEACEILALARSGQQLTQAATAEHGWKHCPPVQVPTAVLTAPQPSSDSEPPRSRLSSFLPARVAAIEAQRGAWLQPPQWLKHIVAVSISSTHAIDKKAVAKHLTAEAFKRVVSLTVSGSELRHESHIFDLLNPLPNLTSLRVDPWRADPSDIQLQKSNAPVAKAGAGPSLPRPAQNVVVRRFTHPAIRFLTFDNFDPSEQTLRPGCWSPNRFPLHFCELIRALPALERITFDERCLRVPVILAHLRKQLLFHRPANFPLPSIRLVEELYGRQEGSSGFEPNDLDEFLNEHEQLCAIAAAPPTARLCIDRILVQFPSALHPNSDHDCFLWLQDALRRARSKEQAELQFVTCRVFVAHGPEPFGGYPLDESGARSMKMRRYDQSWAIPQSDFVIAHYESKQEEAARIADQEWRDAAKKLRKMKA